MRSDQHTPKKTAVILRFPRKRGRPKINRPNRDTGTPELVMKRLKGETIEALDLCLERGLISDKQHWCGIHLRWLYTLRYGAPGVRAIDTTHLGGAEPRPDAPEWRIAREKEYHDALERLESHGLTNLLMGLCVYNERPDFLQPSGNTTKARARKLSLSLERTLQGLNILVKYWKR